MADTPNILDQPDGYATVQDEGSSITKRSILNFVGAGVTATDSGGKSLVTIPGGSGAEIAYVEKTTDTAITGTDFAGSQTVVSAGSKTYDGNPVWVEFTSPYAQPGATAASVLEIGISLDGVDQGKPWYAEKDNSGSAARGIAGCFFRRKLTPSAGTHTILIYAFRGVSDGIVGGGAGGAGANTPAYIRITQA